MYAVLKCISTFAAYPYKGMSSPAWDAQVFCADLCRQFAQISVFRSKLLNTWLPLYSQQLGYLLLDPENPSLSPIKGQIYVDYDQWMHGGYSLG